MTEMHAPKMMSAVKVVASEVHSLPATTAMHAPRVTAAKTAATVAAPRATEPATTPHEQAERPASVPAPEPPVATGEIGRCGDAEEQKAPDEGVRQRLGGGDRRAARFRRLIGAAKRLSVRRRCHVGITSVRSARRVVAFVTSG